MNASRFASSIRLDQIRSLMDSSPAVRLLRAENGPAIVEFLKRTFKSGEFISVGLDELKSRLVRYQDELHEAAPELLTGAAERYLGQWSETGWLTRFLESSSTEPQFQLSRFAEQTIQFVDGVLESDSRLVGTESRLRLVIETLEDVVHGASDNADKRLEHLMRQRAAIDAEIAAIQTGKSIETYRPAQIRERFQTAVELLRGLQSDFRAVEERFQSIAREVQQLHACGDGSRGQILGHALDSEDLLKHEDEGISFFAFVSFLLSPTQQAALRRNIEELQQLTALSDQHESLARVRRMVPSLLAEAEKVMRTTARLSTTLRRLLDANSAAHRMRLANVLREIRQAAIAHRNNAPLANVSLSIDADIAISNPLSRTFWTPPASFGAATMIEQIVDPERTREVAKAFSQLQRLDFRAMRRRIREVTLDGKRVKLSELIEDHPLSGGVVELLGYLQIAHDDSHPIDRSIVDEIVVPGRDGIQAMRIRVPRITFVPRASNRDVATKPR